MTSSSSTWQRLLSENSKDKRQPPAAAAADGQEGDAADPSVNSVSEALSRCDVWTHSCLRHLHTVLPPSLAVSALVSLYLSLRDPAGSLAHSELLRCSTPFTLTLRRSLTAPFSPADPSLSILSTESGLRQVPGIATRMRSLEVNFKPRQNGPLGITSAGLVH